MRLTVAAFALAALTAAAAVVVYAFGDFLVAPYAAEFILMPLFVLGAASAVIAVIVALQALLRGGGAPAVAAAVASVAAGLFLLVAVLTAG